MSKYTFTSTVTRQFPRSPTIAADTIIGIMNRNTTTKVIGERVLGGNHTWALPISNDAMSMIMGRDIGHHYLSTKSNAAVDEYYEKVTARLASVGITLYPGLHAWMVVRAAKSADVGIASECIYNVDDFMAHTPQSQQ